MRMDLFLVIGRTVLLQLFATRYWRHCEERSDEAIHITAAEAWIASLRSQ
jgi:hypothetical protein